MTLDPIRWDSILTGRYSLSYAAEFEMGDLPRVMAAKDKKVFLQDKNPRGIPKAPFIVCVYSHPDRFVDLVLGRCCGVSWWSRV
jgi:hypothetical protein